MATVDLDALAADLRAAGWDIDETKHLIYPSIDVVGEDAEFSVFSDGLVGWRGDCDWTALDIIRRHVSPEPSRRAVVDVDAVLKLVGEYANYKAMATYYESFDDEDAKRSHVEAVKSIGHTLSAIRAMLEPHDAARLRETIAFIADTTDIDEHGRSYFTCTPDEFRMEADAVIRAIGGAR